jgi:hypothetical protein
MTKQEAIQALQTIDQLASGVRGLTVQESIKLVASIQTIGNYLNASEPKKQPKKVTNEKNL